MGMQLLCTFCKKNTLSNTIADIKKYYNTSLNKIYILQDKNSINEFICSYNVNLSRDEKIDVPYNTISVHRKKESCTLYTVNALNYIIMLLNDGILDKTFSINWNNYANMLLITNADGLKKIETKVHDIIKI